MNASEKALPGEAWRRALLRACGPTFHGMGVGELLALLAERGRRVEPRYWPRLAASLALAVPNGPMARSEERRHGAAIACARVRRPLFILGHWRSGTTHLHNLLAQDPRLAYPTLYQVTHPRTFLSRPRWLRRLEGFVLPRRRGFDDVALGLELPAEDEFLGWQTTGRSPFLANNFPAAAGDFEPYLTMQGVGASERWAWARDVRWFLQKLSWINGERPLVLKSPPHTARVALLRRLFPDARFLHIHRDPYRVFQSTMRQRREVMRFVALQSCSDAELVDQVLRQYRLMYDAYFADVAELGPGRHADVAYADLIRDPLGTLAGVYTRLGLGAWAAAEPHVRRYLGRVEGYRPNRYPPLAPELARRIRREWAPAFEVWGYADPARPRISSMRSRRLLGV